MFKNGVSPSFLCAADGPFEGCFVVVMDCPYSPSQIDPRTATKKKKRPTGIPTPVMQQAIPSTMHSVNLKCDMLSSCPCRDWVALAIAEKKKDVAGVSRPLGAAATATESISS